MHLSELTIFTADVDRVADFYAMLLKVAPQRFPGEKAVFRLGGVMLVIHKRAAPMEGYPPDEDHAAYAVADVDEAYRTLTAQGFRAESAPQTYPWGRSAYLRDPDGRLVEIHQA